jgi:hypothetical protein
MTGKQFTRDDVKKIADAYKDIFGDIGPELREYWDLDRKREWGCLTTDFQFATFEQFDEATRRAIEIEDGELGPIELGEALRDVTRNTGVGLSLGACPWTDYGLFQTYDQNKHTRRLTIILGHDWYPIVPSRAKNRHPVDAPLRINDEGVIGATKYINVGAVPLKIVNKSELLVFLNFVPDFRPPETLTTGGIPFPKELYDACLVGFNALIAAISRNFEVKIISWGKPVWEMLRTQVPGMQKPLGVCAIPKMKEWFGRPFELCCSGQIITYLALPHPCDRRNFERLHREHAHKCFEIMGLGGGAQFSQ